jgi:hypothetical protein
MRGSNEDVAAEVARWADLGVEHLALFFEVDSAEGFVAAAERFDENVVRGA